jgi:hypothetical protein
VLCFEQSRQPLSSENLGAGDHRINVFEEAITRRAAVAIASFIKKGAVNRHGRARYSRGIYFIRFSLISHKAVGVRYDYYLD